MIRPAWLGAALHVAAVTAGLLVFALVFTYTGDADLLFAIGGGVGTGLIVSLAARLSRCNTPGETNHGSS
jgi:hypothetical protein